jgi:hypothetical protein
MLIRTSMLLVGLALLSAAPLQASPEARCRSAVSWQNAGDVVDMVAEVKGPVASARYARKKSGRPTYLDLGLPHPDPRRVTVLVMGKNRGAFGRPELRYRDRQICAIGRVQRVGGVLQIEVTTPSQIRVVK